MEVKFRGERIQFNPFRIIILLICIYFFYLNCPYWYDKLLILTANKADTSWIPNEYLNDRSVWGTTLSTNHDLLILPYGKNNFTVKYDTDFYSMGGFWGAVPKVNFSEKSNLSSTIKTVEHIPVDRYPESANLSRKVYPYLKFSIDSNEKLLHKVVNVNTELDLIYPQKIAMSYNFEYTKSLVMRDFKVLYVLPKEYISLKKVFKEDVPEMAITPYLRGAISLLFLFLIIFNVKSLFRKVVD